MSLDFDLTKIDPATREAIKAPGAAWNTTETTIFLTMLVGLGSITAKNMTEWRVRLRLCGALTGCDYADIEAGLKDRIGLRTNVVDEARAGWLRDIAKRIQHKIECDDRMAARIAAEGNAEA